VNATRDLLRLISSIESKSVNRRELVKRGASIGLGATALATALGGVAGPARASAMDLRALLQDDPGSGTRGGTLRVATIGEPPTLDEHQTTATIVAEIGYCMYETLFAYDPQYQPVPMLAESHSISEDGLTQTLTLRQGVPFHNGEIMVADDVIASINRWGQISGVGRSMLEATSEIAKVDDHTIEIRLTRPYGTIPVALAYNTQACVIYPRSVIEAGTLEPLTEYIGTGPYRLVAWQPDAFIRFERFEDYAALPGEPNGYGGHKYAYPDVIEFIPVPDEGARAAGLQAGDYDLPNFLAMGNDQYEVLRDAEGLVSEILPATDWDVYFLNWRSPLMSNFALRQAFAAALDHEPIMISARGGPDFIRLDPGLMMEQTAWHTLAGVELYNINDQDQAREKLQEAGYNGEPIRFMTTQEYPFMYNGALVAQQQLENAGFTIDLQVVDWATLVERRAQPEEWDVFTTSHGFVPDPSQITLVGQIGQFPGWWESEGTETLVRDLLSESEFETRYPIWEQIQANVYSELPIVKVGDASSVAYYRENVGGWISQVDRGIQYWNPSLK
jgi:peptide/nickel transport system substrate-binding protein